VSSIILDKTLNVMATLAIFLFGILAADIALPRLFPISALLLITLILFWPRAQEMVIKLSCRLHPKLRELSASLLSAFSEIGAKKKIYLIAISLAYQMSAIVDVYLIFKAMSTPVPLTAILVFVPLIVMADNVPITTLGLGTREALIIFLFRQYGPASALLGTGVLLSFIEHIIPVLFGLFFMRYFISGFTGNERKVSVKL
jgi:uncharacterized membrane protein YbhN (UPF0104 family)